MEPIRQTIGMNFDRFNCPRFNEMLELFNDKQKADKEEEVSKEQAFVMFLELMATDKEMNPDIKDRVKAKKALFKYAKLQGLPSPYQYQYYPPTEGT